MKTSSFVHRIHVTSDRSAWRIAIDGEEQGLFNGDGAQSRALEAALRRAEDLRSTGTVLVVVEHQDRSDSTRIVRSRLAS